MAKVILQKNHNGEIEILDSIALTKIHGEYLASVMLADDGIEIPHYLVTDYLRAKACLRETRKELQKYFKE